MSALDDGLDQVFGTVEPPTVAPPHDWQPRRSHAGTTESLRADSTAVPADDPPAPRFTLLSPADVLSRPRLPWAVSRVVPLSGLMSIYGPSGSGKSFLTLDLVAALAEGRDWFGHKVKKDRSVVYVALEGAEGIRQRIEAWEDHHGREFPTLVRFVFDSVHITDRNNVLHLSAQILAAGGSEVVLFDTLNRAAPEMDENSSRDMGMALEGCKELQGFLECLVILVSHTGKDATKGLRGHSSLFAALDAAIEVSRTDDRREWKVAKSKDGEDGAIHPFRLEVVELGEDEDGEPITSCVVCADDAPAVNRPKLPKGGNQRIVFDALGPLLRESVEFGKADAPPQRPCIKLDEAILKVRDRLAVPTDRRTERTRAAITGLVSTGVLGLNEGWLWIN